MINNGVFFLNIPLSLPRFGLWMTVTVKVGNIVTLIFIAFFKSLNVFFSAEFLYFSSYEGSNMHVFRLYEMARVLLTDRLVADFFPLPFRGLKFDLWPDIKTGLKRK